MQFDQSSSNSALTRVSESAVPVNEVSPLLTYGDDEEVEIGRITSRSIRRECFGSLEASKDGVYESFRNIIVGDDSSFVSKADIKVYRKIQIMFAMAGLGIILLVMATDFAVKSVGPPKLPVGPYQLLERQEGQDFFNAYQFLEGPDSVGSNGYNSYVSRDTAFDLGIANVTWETTGTNMFGMDPLSTLSDQQQQPSEPFVYMGSAPTSQGPRQSTRIESIQKYDRGLFILDVRHMPTGCGVWPAFWLTDAEQWPKNGEIDIVEGVNYQTTAKTALHSVDGCTMEDAPLGTMTGSWDIAQGVPDPFTGIPDMTKRPARNCFVYAPDQWLNQGCAVTESKDGTLGAPVNAKGGGVYVLEWDPVNHHIRSWVFSPHDNVPENLAQALRTASLPAEHRVAPNPEEWPLPYAHFPIGAGTNCEASPFGHMRIVFNIAFCGSAAGDRFTVDCLDQAKIYDTCEEWIASQPEELLEAYWKIRGVYIYERMKTQLASW